ncbi:MAG TPA: peptide chain release factor 1 [Candidatus Omnitrophota bacterium]|jgi:peptide chain release factor 1|nr:peptide chain release factor 1 [Candidatus Omnitrophota bacterium]
MREALEKAKARFDELTRLLEDPAVHSNPSELKRVSKERSALDPLIRAIRRYDRVLERIHDDSTLLRTEKDPELAAMAKAEIDELTIEKEQIEAELPRLLLPPDPFDQKNVIVEIRAGTGGDEAALFAGEVLRMYTKYAERHGWRVEVLSISQSGGGGIKEVSLLIAGDGVYRRFKYESGVHRVQRVPETEASGRIHTSAVTVAVLPEAEEVDVELKPSDLQIDVFRSSGPGGQSVNTADSAVRIRHLPTGIVVQCQDERSQLKNKAKALKVLRARLLDMEIQEQEKKLAASRKSQVSSGDRSAKIRTYNFPQGRVTDHRIGLTLYRLQDVMEGDLTELTDALFAAEQAERLASSGEGTPSPRAGAGA